MKNTIPAKEKIALLTMLGCCVAFGLLSGVTVHWVSVTSEIEVGKDADRQLNCALPINPQCWK